MNWCDRVALGCEVLDLIEDGVVRRLDVGTEGEKPGHDGVHTSSGGVDGGHRIRTCKGLRPPVFKTGALAIQPALPVASNLVARPRLPKRDYDVWGGPCGSFCLRCIFGSQFAQEQDRTMSNSRVLFRRISSTVLELRWGTSRYVEDCPTDSLSEESFRLLISPKPRSDAPFSPACCPPRWCCSGSSGTPGSRSASCPT